ncbi:hypothetical protein GCM10010919_06060 [Alishewanella longhuensis]|uniref:site-specific DNA-methyltransferase (cytosine-N(4)-specific) n=1 Tax=Alishewanella longhuensis TaxID=1091037 RepID=A0ABQ3KVG1_9ALTE|nr:DNA methyltransferase [Alishewanella longhuensis]GHG61519.1 hypothetical protein GCM10010919_06060 [Alishewanella longhuensis]
MSKLTIDIPTTHERELKNSLKAKGHTVHSWFSEQIDLLLEETSDTQSPKELNLDALKDIDWAFTDDNTSQFTHDIHPYPAKFIPQIPENLILGLSERGDLVLDPFSGSCTTATEAVRLGRQAVSIDANPLSAVIGKAKTALLDKKDEDDLDSLKTHIYSFISAIKSDGDLEIYSDIVKRFGHFAPEIPNHEKWFKSYVFTELSLIRGLILSVTSETAKNIALVAFSRIIIRVSNQDSETRYTAKDNKIEQAETLTSFIESLNYVVRKVSLNKAKNSSMGQFLVGDSRVKVSELEEASVDLIVTSPPYANATDYHLYHRFRMFWLGYDPRELGKIEIGSHLKHQRNNSGYAEYQDDMEASLNGMFKVLKPGKYAALVVGDSIFKEEVFETHKILAKVAMKIGFEHTFTIERPLHETKRSFVKPGRRLRKEQIVILRKPDTKLELALAKLNYKFYDYEIELLRHEIKALTGKDYRTEISSSNICLEGDKILSSEAGKLRALTFTHELIFKNGSKITTDQSYKEEISNRVRKNSTYFTHGLHPYKGKFYPQLAKSLVNIGSKGNTECVVFDPFCGSGTTVLESFLSGNHAFGMDINPIAISISRAKNEILTVEKTLVFNAINALMKELGSYNVEMEYKSEIPDILMEEVRAWFPPKVINKINFLLSKARVYGNKKIVNYFELVLSSIIRNVSQQDPSDLRIRKRKELIEDAPVIELYIKSIEQETRKLLSYWNCYEQGHVKLGSFSIGLLDNRDFLSFEKLGLNADSVDCIVTSPPYATALPYIDTDRLSILVINSLSSSERSSIEKSLTGSREITKKELNAINDIIINGDSDLPVKTKEMLKVICLGNLNDSKAGFRKKNTAALLFRYFIDMKAVMENCLKVLKPGADAFFVVGDSKTKLGDDWFHINTCEMLVLIANQVGFVASEFLKVSVTNDNKINSKNFIENNLILKFHKASD